MRPATTYTDCVPQFLWRMVWALVPAVLACLPGVGHSQQYLMGEEASVTACGFYFLDDGGALNDASSSGEYTTTFCPETAGGALTFSINSLIFIIERLTERIEKLERKR